MSGVFLSKMCEIFNFMFLYTKEVVFSVMYVQRIFDNSFEFVILMLLQPSITSSSVTSGSCSSTSDSAVPPWNMGERSWVYSQRLHFYMFCVYGRSKIQIMCSSITLIFYYYLVLSHNCAFNYSELTVAWFNAY